MSSQINYQWVEIYKLISDELVAFYEKHKDNAGRELYKKCMSKEYRKDFIRVNPWIEKFENIWRVHSIDPVHLFASFNSWKITPEAKKAKLRLYYKILTEKDFIELEKTDLDVFKYFPHIQITRVVGARSDTDQELIWKFFIQIMKNKVDETLYDTILGYKYQKKVYGIGFPVLTIFMFWINSDQYLPLDRNTRSILNKKNERT